MNTLKKDWKPELGLAHVLQVIRCLLIVPFPESSLNEEAGKMFMESYDEYAKYARLMTNIHAKPGPSAAAAVEDGKPSMLGGGGGTGGARAAKSVAGAGGAKKKSTKKKGLRRL